MKNSLLYMLLLLLHRKPIQTEHLSDSTSPLDFESLVKKHVEENHPFVDKTLFIREFLLNSAYRIILSRPPGWCKSMNLNMVHTFITIEIDQHGNRKNETSRTNKLLFSEGEYVTAKGEKKKYPKLKISHHRDAMELQGVYPTFYFDLSTLPLPAGTEPSLDEMISAFSKYMSGVLNSRYQFLKKYYHQSENRFLQSEKDNLKQCFEGTQTYANIYNTLYLITKVIYTHFNCTPVCVLIDNYDSILNKAFVQFGYKTEPLRRFISLITEIFRTAFKNNNEPYVGKTFLSGVLPMILGQMNNFIFYTIASAKFSDFYGFTEYEVDRLLRQTSLTEENKEQIAQWYNGYVCDEHPHFNSFSVIASVRANGETKAYWNCNKTEMDRYIRRILLKPTMRKNVYELLDMQIVKGFGSPWNLPTVYVDYNKRMADFPLLLHYGLVTIGAKSKTNLYYRIPNKETRSIYLNALNITDEAVVPA